MNNATHTILKRIGWRLQDSDLNIVVVSPLIPAHTILFTDPMTHDEFTAYYHEIRENERKYTGG